MKKELELDYIEYEGHDWWEWFQKQPGYVGLYVPDFWDSRGGIGGKDYMEGEESEYVLEIVLPSGDREEFYFSSEKALDKAVKSWEAKRAQEEAEFEKGQREWERELKRREKWRKVIEAKWWKVIEAKFPRVFDEEGVSFDHGLKEYESLRMELGMYQQDIVCCVNCGNLLIVREPSEYTYPEGYFPLEVVNIPPSNHIAEEKAVNKITKCCNKPDYHYYNPWDTFRDRQEAQRCAWIEKYGSDQLKQMAAAGHYEQQYFIEKGEKLLGKEYILQPFEYRSETRKHPSREALIEADRLNKINGVHATVVMLGSFSWGLRKMSAEASLLEVAAALKDGSDGPCEAVRAEMEGKSYYKLTKIFFHVKGHWESVNWKETKDESVREINRKMGSPNSKCDVCGKDAEWVGVYRRKIIARLCNLDYEDIKELRRC